MEIRVSKLTKKDIRRITKSKSRNPSSKTDAAREDCISASPPTSSFEMITSPWSVTPPRSSFFKKKKLGDGSSASPPLLSGQKKSSPGISASDVLLGVHKAPRESSQIYKLILQARIITNLKIASLKRRFLNLFIRSV